MRTSARKTRKSSHFSPYFIKRLSQWLVLSTALTLATVEVSHAAVLTWDPNADAGATGGSGNWLNGAGPWDNAGAALWSNATPDSAIFGGTGAGPFTVTVDISGITADSLTFNTSTYTIAGTGTLTLAGTATVNALGNATIGATLAGTAGLTLGATSTGTLTLSADNSAGLTGTIAVNGGTLSVGADNNLGAAANAVTLGSATTTGTLQATGTFASSRGVTLDATNGGRVDVTGANVLTLNGAIAATAGSLTKIGTGTLVLGNVANLYTGLTAVNNGTLSISSSGNLGDSTAVTNSISLNGGILATTATLDLGVNRAIAIGASGGTLTTATTLTTTVSGALSGSGLLTAAGGGTIVLSANNSGFSGDVTVTSVGGNVTNTTLRLSNASALTSGTVTVNPGAAVAGGNGNQVELAGVTIGGVNLFLDTNGGSNFRSTLLGGSGTSTWSGGIQFNGSGAAGLNVAGGATLNINGNVTAAGGGYTGTYFLRGTGTGVVNGTIILPAGNLAKTDSSTWTINTTGNSWLNTQVSVGTLILGIADALPTAAPVVMGQNDTSAATLDLNGFNQTIAGLSSNPATGTNANSKTVTSAAASTLTVNQASNTSYGGLLSGGISLVKQGVGTLALTGANPNTFTGAVAASAINIQGGTVSFTADNQLGNAANGITLNNGGILSDALTSAQVTLGAARVITVTGTGNGIDVQGVAPTGKLLLSTAGQLTGSGNFTKTGGGDLQLAVANTGYSGSPTVNGGVLEVQTLQSLGTVQPTVTIGGTGELVTTNLTWTAPIIANAGGALSGNGATTVLYSGAITANGAFSARSRFFQTTTTATALTLSGQITGSGKLTAQGPTAAPTGRVLITGNNGATWTGGLQVDPFTQAVVSVGIGTGGTTSMPTGDLTLNGGRLTITPSVGTGLTTTAGIAGRWITTPAATYNGTFSTPWFTTATAATRTDATIDYSNWSGINPATGLPGSLSTSGLTLPQGVGFAAATAFIERYAVVYNGLLNINTGGAYTFYLPSDDGSALFIDGQQILANETVTDGTVGHGFAGPAATSAALTLSSGLHQVTIKNSNGATGGGLQFAYQGPDQLTAPAPAGLNPITNMATVGVTALTNVTGGLTYTLANNIVVPAQASATSTTIETSGFDTTHTGTINVGANGTLVFASATSHAFTSSGAVTLAAGAGLASSGTTGVTVPIATVLTPANVTINGPVTLTGNATLNASGGAQAALTVPGLLTVNGVIDDGAGTFGFTQNAGAGTVVIGGTAANTFDGAYNMAQGVLLLSKTAGVNAIGAGGLNLDTSIATGAAATDYAVVRLTANEQLPNASTLNVLTHNTVGYGATFDLNGFTETVAALNLRGATTNMGRVVMGATGKLIVNGDIVLSNNRNATGNIGREALITGTGGYALNLFAPGTGELNLGGATRNITAQSTQAQLANDGTIDSIITNGGITKIGGQRLVLNGSDPTIGRNSTFGGGVTLNDGILRGGGKGAQTDSAFGTGALTVNKGLTTVSGGITAGLPTLELKNNTAGMNTLLGGTLGVNLVGQSVANVVNYGNAVTVAATVPIFGVDVNNYAQLQNGTTLTGSGGELRFGTLTTGAALQINVIGGNNYSLAFNGLSLGGALTLNDTTGNIRLNNLAGANNIATLAGATGTVIIGGNGAAFSGNVSVAAAGTLRLAPVIGVANNLFGTGTFTTAANPTIGISPVTEGAVLTAGTPGGLRANFYQMTTSTAINATNFGQTPSGVLNSVLLSDAAITNRPPTVTNTSFTQGMVVYSGLLNITAGGAYSFQTFADDASQLVIDGLPIVSVSTGGGSSGITHSPESAPINLTAGLHTISLKIQNGGGGGGLGVSYRGGDSGNAMLPIKGSALQSVAPLTNVANSGINQTIAAAGSLTLDGGGTDLDGGINNLTFSGATGTLTTTNAGGIGTITISGVTAYGANTPTFSTTTGALALLGDLTGSGVITKSGAARLVLAGAKTFTGQLNITVGGVQVTDAASLGTVAGSTVVSSGAVLDLNGTALGAEPITLSGAGIAQGTGLSGATAALYNSASGAASASGPITLALATSIGGLGDITLSGAQTGNFALTKIGPGTLTLAGGSTNTAAYTVSAGILKVANVSALGTTAAGTTVSGGAVLDVNGTALAEPLTISGAGITNYGSQNSLGALINTGAGGITLSGTLTMAAASSIGSSSLAAGGDYTVSGIISGAFALTKVGGNTVTVTANASYTGGTTINSGGIILSGGGFIDDGNMTVNPGATLTIDNSGTNTNVRLGARAVTLTGGNFNLFGNAGAASSETLGGNNLTANSNQSFITLTPNAAQSLTLSSSNNLVRGANGTILIRGNNLGAAAAANVAVVTFGSTPLTIGQFGNAGTASRGIIPWAVMDSATGGDGVSWVNANGVVALTAAEYDTNPVTINALNNLRVNAAATSTAGAGLTLVNSITLGAGGGTVTIGAGNNLQLDSGAIMATATGTIGGAGAINLGIAQSNNLRELVAYTSGAGTNLTIGSTLLSSLPGINPFGPNASPNIAGVGGAIVRGGLTKAGLGTLTLSAPVINSGTTRLNGGTTVLNAGPNTIFFPAATAPNAGSLLSTLNSQNLVVNAGATLDLNGLEQRFGGYASNLAAGSSALPGQGGVITNNSLATDATIYFTQGGSFTVPTSINQSAVVGAKKTNVVRDGGNTLTLTAPNSYTGTTILNGGVTVLQDGGTLAGTSSITINRAVLRIDDSATILTSNRLPTTIPITLNGGAMAFIGRGGGTQNVINVGTGVGGSLNIGTGAALLQGQMIGQSNANTAGDLRINIGNLVKGGTGAQVFFDFIQNGNQNVGDNPRYFISQLNGGALPAPGAMLPAWITVGGYNPASTAGGTSGTINGITVNTTDFAQYDPATGIRPVLYTSTIAPGSNVNLGATTTLPVGGAVINSLRFDGASTLIFGDAGYDVLNLQSGGLMSTLNGNNRVIGITNNAGKLTAGGVNPGAAQELFIYNTSGNTFTINAKIIDNPTDGSAVNVVVSSGLGSTGNTTLAGTNTYTGTTYVNNAILVLNNTVGGLAVPGNIIAGGGTSNASDSQNPANQAIQLNASNQIATTATVTLNGGTLLNLNNNSQTLANLVFGADGGSFNNQGPGVQTGTGTLTLTGNITATNLLQATTIPTMIGNLAIAAGAHPVNVGTFPGAPGETGLVINSVLSGSGTIDKVGAGVLGIGGVSPGYTAAINVNTGSVMFTSSLGTASVGSTVTLAAAGTLNAGGYIGTVGALAGTGTVTSTFSTLAQVGGQVNVGSNNTLSSFGGLVTGVVTIGKVGSAGFSLTNTANDYTGGTLVNSGTLTLAGAGLSTTGSGLVTVNNTGTLTGSGIVNGGLRFNAGSSASFALPAVPGAAFISTGASSVTSSGAAIFNFTGAPGVGLYPLIDYGGAAVLPGQLSGISIGSTPGGGLLYGLVHDTAGTSVNISVETVHAGQTWTGAAGGTWNTVVNNWSGLYVDTNQVSFTNAGLSKTISGPAVNPQAINVTNSGLGNDYSIANSIGGSMAGGVSKSGSGVLQLTGANTFWDAPVTVTGGTLRATVSSAASGLGSANVVLGNGTTLQLDPTANTGTAGITGRYFNQASNANTLGNMHFQLPAVATVTDVTTGVFNITWNPANRPANGLVGAINNGAVWESFGGQWVGKLNITAAGPYSIFTSSDDASRVFIDGVQINNNDGGKGVTEGGATAFLNLGLHDVRFEFLQGTGGGQARLGWQGPGIAKADIPATALFAAENVSGGFADNSILVGTNLSVSGAATLALSGNSFTAVQLGGLTLPGGSTLNVTGEAGRQLRAGGTFLSGGTATLNSNVDVNPGLLTDGGVAATLVKQGAGRLVIDNTNPLATGQANVLTAGTVLEIQGGKLAWVGQNTTTLPLNSTTPLGAASVRLNGGNLSIETKQGTVTLDNAITVSQNAVIEQQASSNLALTLGSATNGIAVSGGSTLTFDVFGGTRGTTNQGAQNANVLTQGANLIVAGAITGTGNLAIRSTQTDFGQYPVLGNTTFTNNNTIAGTLTLTGGYGSQGVVTTMPLTLNSNGRLSGNTGITLNAAQLTLNDNDTVATGRINTTVAPALTLREGNLLLQASTGANSTETFAAIISDAGFNRIIVQNATASIAGTVVGSTLTRNNRSTIMFQGTSMGAQATNAGLVKFTDALAGQLKGGGGADASATVSILPYAFGASNPGTNPPTYMPVTYNATNGIRPINTTTEITTLAASVVNGNARDSIGAAASPVPTVNAINSWTLDNSANATALTATLTTNPLLFSGTGAGLLLLTASNTTNQASALTVTGTNINFQGAEGVIISTGTSGATISSVIQGTNGITISGNNNINSNAIVTTTTLGGSVTLTADNSAGLTGTITINGRLILNNGTGDLPLGNAANPVQFGGGTLLFNNAGTTLAATRAVTLIANSFGVIDTNGNADTIAGAIGGSGGLVKVNTGTLTLSNAANNYSGTTTVLQGALVTNTGPQGNIVLNGTNTAGGGNNTLLANVAFTQAVSGTYLGNISGIGSVTINNTTAAPITITLGDPTDATKGVNTYGGGLTFANTNATTLRGTTSSLVGGIVTSANDSITLEQSFNGTAFNVLSGPAPLLKLGNGAVTVVNSSSYTGTTTISAGSLIAATSSLNAANGAFGNAGTAVTLGDGATTANNSSPGVFTGGAVTIGRAITVANQATTGVYRIGGGADALSTISGAISLNQPVTVSQILTTLTNSLNITGGISSASAGVKLVTFAGPGAVNVATTALSDGAGGLAVSVTGGVNAFNVANTYGGFTSVSNGSLLVGVVGALPVTTDLNVTGGTVNLNNAGLASSASQTVASLAGTGGGTVTNTDLTATRTLTANQASVTAYSGLLAGNLALTKSGAGTLALSAVNTYTGGTAITGGILSVNANAALGDLTGGVALSNDATLQAAGPVTSNRTFTLSTVAGGNIDTNGQTVTLDTGSTVTGTALEKLGVGTLNIKGVETYGSLTTTAGMTNIYTAIGTGTSTVAANATLNFYASQTLASLTIGAGTEVTFGDALPFGDEDGGKSGGFTAAFTPPSGAVSGGSSLPGSAVVPEPGSIGLLLTGALGLLGRRRRKNN